MLRKKLLIFCMLLSTVSLARAIPSNDLDVPWYSSPKVDGAIGQNEYPPWVLSLPWGEATSCKFYLCQNSGYVFIAVTVPDSTYSANDSITICIGKEPPSPGRMPRIDDYELKMTRNRRFSAPGLAKYKNATTTIAGEWRVEVAVSFSELGIVAGQARRIGFAVFIADGGQELMSWPDGAGKDTPSTWGALSSTYSWGTVDLEPYLVPILSPQNPVAGDNVSINFAFTNKGKSPIANVSVGFYADGVLFKIVNDTRIIRPSLDYAVNATWRATPGNHTIKIELDPLKRIYETNKDNNAKNINISIRLPQLTVKAREGATITVNEVAKPVGPSEEVVFTVNIGNVNITAGGQLYTADLRYVFEKWRINGQERTGNPISLRISGDAEVEALYKTEYMVKMLFQDSKGVRISPPPSQVMLTAANGSAMILNGTYNLWLQKGMILISNIIWSGVNVKPGNSSYTIVGPRTLMILCKIYDVTVNVRDGLDFPVGGANVTLLLPNQTRVWRTTDADGNAFFYQVPAGTVSCTVSSLGIMTSLGEREVNSVTVIRASVAISFNTVVLGIVMPVVALSVVAFFYLRMRKKPQKGEEGKADKDLSSLGAPV
jgi:hypothetical protein